MLETIGWFSTVCFAISGVPFAVDAYRTKRVEIGWSGILLILLGSVGMLVYELGTSHKAPQVADFFLNALCWVVVAKVKWEAK